MECDLPKKDDRVVLDDALLTEQPEDAGARDLQDVGDVAIAEARQRVEAELTVLVLDVVATDDGQ